MAWKLTGDVDEYLAEAGDFLRSRAAENTVLLAAAETVRARGMAAFGNQAPQFGWCAGPGGDVTGAFLHTPPYGVALTAMDGPGHGTRRPGGAVMAAGSYSTVTGRWSEARRVRSVSVT